MPCSFKTVRVGQNSEVIAQIGFYDYFVLIHEGFPRKSVKVRITAHSKLDGSQKHIFSNTIFTIHLYFRIPLVFFHSFTAYSQKLVEETTNMLILLCLSLRQMGPPVHGFVLLFFQLFNANHFRRDLLQPLIFPKTLKAVEEK